MVEIFEVTFRVMGTKNLTTLISAVTPECKFVGMKPVINDSNGADLPKKKMHYYANGMKSKGVSGDDCVLGVLKAAKAPMTTEAVSKETVAKGFASTSAASILYKLRKNGLVKRNKDGLWALA